MWIERNINGEVIGAFRKMQPLSDHPIMAQVEEDHPDLIAYRALVQASVDRVPIDPRDTKIAELEARLATLERTR